MRLDPLAEPDFGELAALADQIWRAHYGPLVGLPMVEYILSGRFTPERLRTYLDSPDRGMALLRDGEETIGYCSWSLTGVPGEMKLEQLYVSQAHQGKGCGGLMLDRVEAEARALGCHTLMLTVYKGNVGALAVYRKAGFTIREAVRVDIGQGFVMDDYVMEKGL